MMLEKLKLNRNFKLINSILNMITNSKSQQEINISESFLFIKRYNIAYINKKIDKIELDKTINLGETLTFFNHKIYFTKDKPNSWQNYIKLCYNKVKLPLRIRTRINGDIIELSSGKKKVKDLLIDKKIPIEIRNTLPMVINDKDIIWIPSVAKSALIKDDLGDGDIYLIDEEN
jgi:tRNA(Ile)-lysidine synthase